MKPFLTCLISLGLLATSVGQVNSQTSTTGSSQTSANASQSGASVTTNNSMSADGKVKAGKKTNPNASGSVSQNASASTNDLQIPSGTKVPAVLDKSIDSKKCKQGDEVVAKTTSDVVSNGKVIIPKNSKLIGHVTQASATANGQSDSKLGIVFDKAMLRNGATVSMQARIQALAGPVVSAASSMSDDDAMSTPMGGGAGASANGSGRAGSGLGGAVGGVTNTVGNTAGTVGNTAGNAVGSAGSTIDSTAGVATNTVGRTAGGATSATGALSGNSTGVIGLKNLQLNSEASDATNGSVITSAGKNVKLDSGSRMVLDVVGSSR